MWRRFGDVAFAAVVAVAVTLEAVPLAFVTWSLLERLTGSPTGPRPTTILLGAIATTTLGLVAVTGYVLAYQHVSGRREAQIAERRQRWVSRWLGVLYEGEDAPGEPLDRDAVGALLDLREAMRGDESLRLLELLRRFDVSARLTRSARSGRVAARLEALDGLSRARVADALPTLLSGIGDPEPAVRVASARAAARTLASIEDPAERDRAAGVVAMVLERHLLPLGVVEEMLLLAEDAAPALLRRLLGRDGASPDSLRAALDAVARLQLLEFAEDAARFLEHGDPEVRAAALRAVARVALLPPEHRPSLLGALGDEIDFVRIHATAAAGLLPREQSMPALWARLADRSWWVRRAAAAALADLGSEGFGELERAAETHPDRFARDIAAQTLRDRVPDLMSAVAG